MLLESTPVAHLRALFNGQVIAPGDAAYDRARTVFYGGIDRRPAAIIRAEDAGDVCRVVLLASQAGLELAVRSGGHSTAGHGVSEGGLVLDMSEMCALQIDAAARTAWAESGLTAGAYTRAAGAHGLATGFGDTGSVGIGGLTLGGGVGFLVRKYGLTIDDLLAAEVVTAEGQLLYTDAESYPDLFWAIRGGGGNFGVATRFKFRLHPLDTVVGGMLILPASADTLESFIAEAEAAPDELSAIINLMPAPPLPFVPPKYHGQLALIALMCYAGQPAAGERVMAPFRALATPLVDLVRPMRYSEMFPPEEGSFHPRVVGRTLFIDHVDHAVAKFIISMLEASEAPMRVVQLRVLGGAMARVPADATAFAHRTSRIMANVAAFYTGPGDRPVQEAWATEFAEALRQSDGGAYVNFLSNEGEARVRAAYPGPTWDRLRAIKRRYDPANFFRLNQNTPPAAV